MKRQSDAAALRPAERRSANGKAPADDRELTIDELIIDVEEPVENVFIEKERRLLTSSLYTSWGGPGRGRPFLAAADVGVFPEKKQTPIVPDVLLSLDIPPPADPSRKENRSYFLWIMGKPPDVVFEFVSDRRGGEEGHKKKRYAQIGVRHYVIFDPERWLRGDVLRSYELRDDGRYHALKEHWFPTVGLGLTLWQGIYEQWDKEWLRWRDRRGRLIPTPEEAVAKARRKAQEETRRRKELEAQLRARGIEPSP